MNNINPNIFHAYDVRGFYPQEITLETAYWIAWAFGKYLKTDQKKTLPMNVILGQDMRGSSPFLAKEVVRGLNDQGIDVVDAGKVSTAAFYYAASFKDCAGGIMVTASHMPKEYNGFKLCLEKAYPVGRNTGLAKIKQYALEGSVGKVKDRGKISFLEKVTHEYVLQDLSSINAAKIKKFKIAADPANCMGATYLEELFNQIDCDPIKMNWDLNGNMPIHEANPLKYETLQQIQQVIRNERADIGVATDGDGDRVGILDEKADFVPSDMVAGLVAFELLKKNKGARIGHDLRFSRSFSEMVRQAGGEPMECPVGYAFIKAIMKEKDILFAGELSGHFFYRENFNNESPVFVVAQILSLMSSSGKPLSELWRSHKKYFHSGEINFEIADKQKAMQALEEKYSDGKIDRLDGVKIDYEDWWFNVRPSANDPVLRLTVEARTEEAMKQKVGEISDLIKSSV